MSPTGADVRQAPPTSGYCKSLQVGWFGPCRFLREVKVDRVQTIVDPLHQFDKAEDFDERSEKLTALGEGVKQMNLNALRGFAHGASHENLQRAADELSLSRGAVPQRIKQLEIDLGDVLLIRGRARHIINAQV